MRHLILLIILTLSIASAGCQPSTPGKTTFTVGFEYWEVCETGKGECQPLMFQRNTIDDNVLLITPCGGTETEVFLMKKGNEKRLKTIHVTTEDCPPTFDLTGLADGDYIAYMLACNLGGPVNFTLTTKNE